VFQLNKIGLGRMCKPTWHRAIVGLIEENKMVKMIDYIWLKMKKKKKKKKKPMIH
jgi:hypothetical protein